MNIILTTTTTGDAVLVPVSDQETTEEFFSKLDLVHARLNWKYDDTTLELENSDD